MNGDKTLSERADELEAQQMEAFEERIITKSLLFHLADGEQPTYSKTAGPGNFGQGQPKLMLMGDDPRLPQMPEKPTFMDFLRCRFTIGGQQHLLQSARLAKLNGLPEKMVFACLLHDIAITGFIRADHGYWGGATAGTVCGRGGQLGDPDAPVRTLLPGRDQRLRIPRELHPHVRGGLSAGTLHRGGAQAGAAAQMVPVRPGDLHQ